MLAVVGLQKLKQNIKHIKHTGLQQTVQIRTTKDFLCRLIL